VGDWNSCGREHDFQRRNSADVVISRAQGD
jgi:hypothetical protein